VGYRNAPQCYAYTYFTCLVKDKQLLYYQIHTSEKCNTKKEELVETEESGVEGELHTDCPYSIRLHIRMVRIVTLTLRSPN